MKVSLETYLFTEGAKYLSKCKSEKDQVLKPQTNVERGASQVRLHCKAYKAMSGTDVLVVAAPKRCCHYNHNDSESSSNSFPSSCTELFFQYLDFFSRYSSQSCDKNCAWYFFSFFSAPPIWSCSPAPTSGNSSTSSVPAKAILCHDFFIFFGRTASSQLFTAKAISCHDLFIFFERTATLQLFT